MTTRCFSISDGSEAATSSSASSPPTQFLQTLLEAYAAARETTGYMNIVIHPHLCGRLCRLEMLRRFFRRTREDGDVLFATSAWLADYILERFPAEGPAFSLIPEDAMPWKKDFTLSDEMSPSGIVWPAGKAAVSVVVDYSVPAGAEGIDEAAIAYAGRCGAMRYPAAGSSTI